MATTIKEEEASPSARSEVSKAAVASQLRKLYRGDSGLIPIVVGLIALIIYFQARSSVFLSASNLTNLLIQSTVYILLGMAEIWLLLLGEIDLSVGFVSGLGGAIGTTLVDSNYHWSWFIALPLAVLITTAIGAMNGLIVIKLRLPSFIVTLATYLAAQGVLIWVIDSQSSGGSISVQEKVLYDLVGGQLTPFATWAFIIVCVAILSFIMLRSSQKRKSNGLDAPPLFVTLTKIVFVAIVGVALVLIFNTNRSSFVQLRGMPFAIPIDLFLLAAGTFVLTKTKAGRYMYAIGGNAEAARRSGIKVDRYRLMAFMITGFTAGIAGLLYASRLGGLSTNIDPTLTLYSIAAAVIGGASLFGGRGKMVNAVIGGLVIATIYNGMALLNMSATSQYIATALVLLAAVTVDSVARRGSTNIR